MAGPSEAPSSLTASVLSQYSFTDLGGSVGDDLLAQSQYAQVVFRGVQDWYATDADVCVHLSLTSGLQPAPGDRVALLRVGWARPDEALLSLPAPLRPADPAQPNEHRLMLKASQLPKDEEFYQLCYLALVPAGASVPAPAPPPGTATYEVRGASVPFQFRPPPAEDLVVVDEEGEGEEGGLAVVRSRQAVAAEMRQRCDTLQLQLSNAQGLVAELRARNKGELWAEQRSRQELAQLEAERSEAQKQLGAAQLQLQALEATNAALAQDVQRLQAELRRRVQVPSEAVHQQQDMLDALRQGKELAAREMHAALARAEEAERKLDAARKELEQEKEQGTAQREQLLVQLTQLAAERMQQRSLGASLETELSEVRAELQAAQEREQQLQAELRAAQRRLDTALALSLPQADQQADEEAALCRELAAAQLELPKTEAETQTEAGRTDKSSSSSGDAHVGPVVSAPELASAVQTLCDRLVGVIDSDLQVQAELVAADSELQDVADTTQRLGQELDKLEVEAATANRRYEDAQDASEATLAALRAREMESLKERLGDARVCLESAVLRREQLHEQRTELQQERAVLAQQRADALRALAQWAANTLGGHSVEQEGTESSECDALRQRLHDAAEAYRVLYHEKTRLERRLARALDGSVGASSDEQPGGGWSRIGSLEPSQGSA